MKTILVATDGSDASTRAVVHAARMARDYRAKLVIVNVVGGYGIPGRALRRLSDPHHAWLQETLAAYSEQTLVQARKCASEAGALEVVLESRVGEVAAAILKAAQDVDADLLVVGKRGAGRARGLLLGSVSQHLVSLARLPVTVVP